MAVLRVSHQELQKELESHRESTSVTNADLERAQSLNATLENDLLTLQQEASNQFPMSAKSVSSRYPTSATYARSPFGGGYTPRRSGSPTSSIISGFDPQRSPYDSLDSLHSPPSGPPGAMGGGSGMLPLIQAQRDRFKTKNSQLESELQKQYTTVASLRQEIAALQKDNLTLYEKTRYISTYQRNPPHQSSSASAYAAPPSSTSAMAIGTSDSTSSGLSLDRYRSAYEANISPFAAFRGREAARAYKRMSVPERMVWSVTRLVLANRTSRNLFAVYCVALHVLVFVMLYWMQGIDVEKHASLLSGAAAAAGGLGTGGGGGGGGSGGAEAHHGEWLKEGLDGGRPGG